MAGVDHSAELRAQEIVRVILPAARETWLGKLAAKAAKARPGETARRERNSDALNAAVEAARARLEAGGPCSGVVWVETGGDYYELYGPAHLEGQEPGWLVGDYKWVDRNREGNEYEYHRQIYLLAAGIFYDITTRDVYHFEYNETDTDTFRGIAGIYKVACMVQGKFDPFLAAVERVGADDLGSSSQAQTAEFDQ